MNKSTAMATEKSQKDLSPTKESAQKDLENAVSAQNADPQSSPVKSEKTKMVASNTKTGLLMGFGAFGVVLGAIAVVYWPAVFFSQLKRMMILSPTSTSFSIWREVPIPMYMEFFMWNITNVDEILANKTHTIKVEQCGPYVYRERHIKDDLTWNDENSTVTYFNKRTWNFEPEMSNGSLSDMITSVNPVVATVAYITRRQNTFLKLAVNTFMQMSHDNLFLTANVSSWLFDGIDDPVLDFANRFPNIPFTIPYDKFGWFYDRNGSLTFDGSFNMNTGAKEFGLLGNIHMWNYSNRTFYRDHCGEVRGSTGELWAPELGQPEVEVFAPDLCAYMTLSKNGTVSVDGIEGVQYAANDSVFDNGHHYPRMACFCDEVRDEDCLPSGALNVSRCRYGAPAFVSLPHFLMSDPHYPSKIQGLDPKPEHNFRLALEMYTGMPLAVSAQLQINLLVRHVEGILQNSLVPPLQGTGLLKGEGFRPESTTLGTLDIGDFKCQNNFEIVFDSSINNILPDPDTLVPMFWFRQELTVTPEYSRLARFALNLRDYVPYGLYVLTVIGVGLLLWGVVLLIQKLFKSPDTTPILEEQENMDESS